MVSGHTHKNRKSLPRSRLSLDPSAPADRRSFCQTRMHHARDLRDNCDDVPLRVGTCERRELLHRRNGKTTCLYCPSSALRDFQIRQDTKRRHRGISFLRASCEHRGAHLAGHRAQTASILRASCEQPRKRRDTPRHARHAKTRRAPQHDPARIPKHNHSATRRIITNSSNNGSTTPHATF